MSVADIMSRNVISVEMDDPLSRVKELFDRHHFHHLLVMDQGKLMGVISDRDLLRNVSPFLEKMAERPQDLATLTRKVHQIMSRQPVTVRPEMELCDAAELLLKNNVSCLPVVFEDGRVAGIITWRDLLRSVCPVRLG